MTKLRQGESGEKRDNYYHYFSRLAYSWLHHSFSNSKIMKVVPNVVKYSGAQPRRLSCLIGIGRLCGLLSDGRVEPLMEPECKSSEREIFGQVYQEEKLC